MDCLDQTAIVSIVLYLPKEEVDRSLNLWAQSKVPLKTKDRVEKINSLAKETFRQYFSEALRIGKITFQVLGIREPEPLKPFLEKWGLYLSTFSRKAILGSAKQAENQLLESFQSLINVEVFDSGAFGLSLPFLQKLKELPKLKKLIVGAIKYKTSEIEAIRDLHLEKLVLHNAIKITTDDLKLLDSIPEKQITNLRNISSQ